MFDLTSSKLLILGVVALIVVGPKELPFLLRTIGKYMGMIRRQANEFRAQFDEAMREAELDSIKKDLETVARDAENSIRDVTTSVAQDIHAAGHDIERSVDAASAISAPRAASGQPTEAATSPSHDTPGSAVEALPPESSDAPATHAAPSAERAQPSAGETHELAKTGT